MTRAVWSSVNGPRGARKPVIPVPMRKQCTASDSVPACVGEVGEGGDLQKQEDACNLGL